MDFNNDGLAATFREFLGYFVKQFFPLVNTQIEKLYFARFDYPLLVFPVYILAVIGLFKFWQQPKKVTAVFAGLGAGLLFYFYFHYWVYWFFVICLLFLYVFLFERKDKVLFRNFLVLIAVLSMVAAPYFINYFGFRNSESGHDYSLRLGIAEGRQPGLTTVGSAYLFYSGLALAIYFFYWHKNRRKAVLLWSFLLAAVLVWNVQMITGFVPAPNNWRRTISPLLYLIIFIIIYDLSRKLEEKRPVLKKFVVGAVIFFAIMVVVKKSVNVFEIWRRPERRILDSYAFSREIKDSWDWINANLAKEPKIISDSFLTSLYLNAYTSARPFLPIGNATSQFTEKLEERFLIANKLFGISSEIVRSKLSSDLPLDCSEGCFPNTEENLRKNLWHLYFHYFRQGPFHNYMAYPRTISAGYIEVLMNRYENTDVSWQAVDAEYVYYGPWEKQFGDIDFSRNKELTSVYENSEVKIYRIEKDI